MYKVNRAWLSESFEAVVDYIILDNASDMNKDVLDLIAILRDLQDKVRYEEGDSEVSI